MTGRPTNSDRVIPHPSKVNLVTAGLALPHGRNGFTSLWSALATIGLVALPLGWSAAAGPERSAPPAQATHLAAKDGLDQVEITQLRRRGAVTLTEFWQQHGELLRSDRRPPAELRAKLDALCAQRDCHASQLFWYTDWEQAKIAARISGKPILSLHLLGRLDQELSCANSRFFRVALYANAEVSAFLRQHFILHWQSVRPVPKVTIDFGDGRKLERTLTGNSIHYVLTPDGQPVEALPGLYGPQAFVAQLRRAESLARDYTQRPPTEQFTLLQQYHRDRLAALQDQWSTDLQAIGLRQLPAINALPNLSNAPNASDAGRIAYAKAMVELPLVSRLSMMAERNFKALQASTDDAAWVRIAQRHAQQARLDDQSRALMQQKNDRLANPAALANAVRQFEQAMAVDTMRNEYLLHAQLHQWFIEAQPATSLTELNQRVYSELFLTPSSDPWLGLWATDQYTGIEGDGVVQ